MKVIWSLRSLNQIALTYHYWNNRNQSKLYSNKLERERLLAEKRISQNPLGFKKTSEKNIRVYIVEHFKLFYTIKGNEIYMLSFFDSRRKPKLYE